MVGSIVPSPHCLRPQTARPGGEALAVGVSVPLLLRGQAVVANWAPHGFSAPSPDLYATIAALNQSDPVTGPAIAEGLRARGFSTAVITPGEQPNDKYAFSALARAAGELLGAADGPRIAAMEIGGWDTHAEQANRLTGPLKQLDTGLVALKTALGPAWAQTAVLVMTEFGRTARVNGTKGTDHGTGTVAFVLGGAVAGGQVKATWPGLGSGQLFENRDLAPTADLRAVAKGILVAHLRLRFQRAGADIPRQRRRCCDGRSDPHLTSHRFIENSQHIVCGNDAYRTRQPGDPERDRSDSSNGASRRDAESNRATGLPSPILKEWRPVVGRSR